MVRKKICVLFGGASSEHDVSLMSVASVLKNLDNEKYDVISIGITKDGRWLYNEDGITGVESGSWLNGAAAFISPDPSVHGLIRISDESIATTERVDVVFPVLHGKFGEDGTVQGLLELAGIPYVGCGVLGSAVCMDKVVANLLCDAANIPRCEWEYITADELDTFSEKAASIEEKLGYPIFVKPANAGSSIGISKVRNREELIAAAAVAAEHDDRILFERFVDGHEVECAVIGNEKPEATLPGEIIIGADFYDYEDKYVSGNSRCEIPANLPMEKLIEVKNAAEKAYKTLCCQGLARADFFVEKSTGKVLLNEINTLPGFTNISMYPKLMIDKGISYTDMLDELVLLALKKKGCANG